MNILLVLLPVSLVLLGVAVWSFFWAVNKGQFDDLDTPALRILEDDLPVRRKSIPTDAFPDNDDPRGQHSECVEGFEGVEGSRCVEDEGGSGHDQDHRHDGIR